MTIATLTRGTTRWSRATLTLAAASLGFVVVQFDVTVVNVALERIGAALGGDVGDLQWVVNAYTVVFASLILTAGALGDRIGAKRVFIAGFAIFTAASLACGAAPGLGALIAARAAQGIGAAILVPCSLALLSHGFRDDRARAWAIGIWAAGASVALAAGPVAGGVLVDSVGWRSIFLVNLPIGAAGIWLTLRYADETEPSRGRGLDLPGQVAAIAALALFAGALIAAGGRGWRDPLILAGFGLAIASAAAFVTIEARSAGPMLPLGFFRHADFSGALVAGLAVNTSFYGLIFVISLYLQQVEHASPLITGLTFVPTTVAVGIANVAAGRLTGHGRARAVMIAGQVLAALGCLSLLWLGSADGDGDGGGGALWLRLIAIGGGIGLAVPALTAVLLDTVGRRQSGVASGVLNTTRQAGSVIGVALFGALVAQRSGFVPGLHTAAAIAAGLLILGVGVAWRCVDRA